MQILKISMYISVDISITSNPNHYFRLDFGSSRGTLKPSQRKVSAKIVSYHFKIIIEVGQPNFAFFIKICKIWKFPCYVSLDISITSNPNHYFRLDFGSSRGTLKLSQRKVSAKIVSCHFKIIIEVGQPNFQFSLKYANFENFHVH